MNNELIHLETLDRSPLVQILRDHSGPAAVSPALIEFAAAHDILWQTIPLEGRDFLLRFLKSTRFPIQYPELPVWAARAANHVITICFPTLRNLELGSLDEEGLGRLIGHMMAICSHAKHRKGIFAKADFSKIPQLMEALERMDAVLPTLVGESLRAEPAKVDKFIKGLHFAFSRTFDVLGYPKGWNTNSPVLLGVVLLWRSVAASKFSFGTLHKELARMLGAQVIGTDERVKKICQRIGLRFPGADASTRQGTAKVLTVPAQGSGG